MKFTVLASLVLLSMSAAIAQVRTPPLSQKQTIKQKVGFTEVTIEYCRPLVRGRIIFGGLEPYGEVWRTGANRNTQIYFSQEVNINGQTLKADTYTLFTRPNPKEWQVYFYPYDNGYGVPEDFDEAKAIAAITVPVVKLNRKFENLTINLENVTESDADLTIIWESTYIAIPISFGTEEEILNKIEAMVNDHSGDYYMAAKYYLDNDKDLDKAKAFIQKSIALRDQPGGTPKFWIFQLQAEILLKNGEKEAALASAEKAYEMAKPRGPEDMYVKQIEELLEKMK